MMETKENKNRYSHIDEPIRLQKFISMCGITSRRNAESMILNKRVHVNGNIVTKLGTKILASYDRVTVDGKLIKNIIDKVYLMINKPCGCLCTLRDDRKRPTVIDILRLKTRVYPVGRLDYNSEGLLLLTNDGEFAHLLSHPRKKVRKLYHVKVSGIPDEKILLRMKKGVFVEGVRTSLYDVKLFRKTGKNSWLSITLYEGKNRQIRNVCRISGHPVIKLKRVEYGNITIGALLPGQYRSLTLSEIKGLKRASMGN